MAHMPAPALFPRPRLLDSFDETLSWGAAVREAHNGGLRRQGYELEVTAHGARLDWADEAGRRYGTATIDQLRRDDGTLPGVHVADWPDFTHRGYLLDVSRDRVPTRPTLERLVERLATCRYNQLQLYIEHTFAFRAHRSVWEHASPITHEDLTWLDHRCQALGIELVVNQNTFGHFGRWLAHAEYRGRAECPDGVEIVPGFTLPPSVLAPTEDNAAFARSLVEEQLACVTSRTANVGCDETFELGRGVSADRVAAEGIDHVYGEHLHRIIDPLLSQGIDVQFWADVVRTHPAILDALGEPGCTPLVWNYDAPDVAPVQLPAAVTDVLASIGVDLDAPTDFATILEPFAAAGRPFWVAPGTSTWQSLIGRLPNAEANLDDAAVAGLAAGAEGYLVTDWGDTGHLNPPAVSLPPIAYGGALAWCADANRDLDLAAAVNRHLVDDPASSFGGVLVDIGGVATATGVTARNASPIFQALVPTAADLSAGDPDTDAVVAVIELLETARSDLGGARPRCEDAGRLTDELDVAIGLATHGARRMLARAKGQPLDASEAAQELSTLTDRYRRAWSASSRPGGLADSAALLEKTLGRYSSDPATT